MAGITSANIKIRNNHARQNIARGQAAAPESVPHFERELNIIPLRNVDARYELAVVVRAFIQGSETKGERRRKLTAPRSPLTG